MTHITVQNLGPGPRSVKNIAQQNVNLLPGDKRTIDMHPIHARMLLKDAEDKTRPPKFAVMIDPEERVAMEQACEAEGYKGQPRAFKNLTPAMLDRRLVQANQQPPETQVEDAATPQPKTEKRYITDPKTVDDEAGGSKKKASAKPVIPKRKPRERRRPAKRTE